MADDARRRRRVTSNQEALAQRTAAPAKPGQKTIWQLIESQKDQIARALPRHLDADRLTRIALTEVRRTPKLADCDASTLLGAVMMCAQTGLEPGPLGHCYLVPYGRECTWILGYKGIIQLARRSGEIETIIARTVHENDDFDFAYGDDEHIRHRPTLDGERGPAVAVYGVARYLSGGKTLWVMSRDDIEKRRGRSAAAKNKSGPWETDWDAMARKTVIRAMAPFLPLTIEAAEAVASDERTIRFDPDIAAPVAADPTPALEAAPEPDEEAAP